MVEVESTKACLLNVCTFSVYVTVLRQRTSEVEVGAALFWVQLQLTQPENEAKQQHEKHKPCFDATQRFAAVWTTAVAFFAFARTTHCTRP